MRNIHPLLAGVIFTAAAVAITLLAMWAGVILQERRQALAKAEAARIAAPTAETVALPALSRDPVLAAAQNVATAKLALDAFLATKDAAHEANDLAGFAFAVHAQRLETSLGQSIATYNATAKRACGGAKTVTVYENGIRHQLICRL